jgi:hypothetical protein
MDEQIPKPAVGTGMPFLGERSRMCEVPLMVRCSCFFHTAVFLMPFAANRVSCGSMLQNCCAVMASRREIRIATLHVIVRGMLP